MSTEARLHRSNNGINFRAYTLRGESVAQLDPFLAVDHAWMSGPTFPPHPHAGFSAVSYLFLDSETSIANRDSLGNKNIIQPGGLHWTAAGRGVVHEEIPAEHEKTVHMLQIFVNLPKEKQKEHPFALSLPSQDIPVIQETGSRIRVVLGQLGEIKAPIDTPTEVNVYDISLEDKKELRIPIPAGHNAFVLPIFGSSEIDGKHYASDIPNIPVYPHSDQVQEVQLIATNGDCKVVVFTGKPLHQSVYWKGPMALSTQTDLADAVSAYQQGKFGAL